MSCVPARRKQNRTSAPKRSKLDHMCHATPAAAARSGPRQPPRSDWIAHVPSSVDSIPWTPPRGGADVFDLAPPARRTALACRRPPPGRRPARQLTRTVHAWCQPSDKARQDAIHRASLPGDREDYLIRQAGRQRKMGAYRCPTHLLSVIVARR